MKKHSIVSALFVVSTFSASASVIWTGSTSSDVFDDSNWDLTASGVTSVVANVSVDDDISVVGGTMELPNLPGQGRFQIGNEFTMTLDNSTFSLVAGGNDGVGGAPMSTGVNVNLINGSQLNTFFIVNAVALDIDATSSATFGGGGGPINISTVNLTDGAIMDFLAETPAAFRAEHLSKITVDGAPAVEGANILVESFNGASGSRVTVIPVPEPSSVLLGGIAALAVLVRRRK